MGAAMDRIDAWQNRSKPGSRPYWTICLLLGGIVLVLLGLFIYMLYSRTDSGSRLQEAIDEADRLDPGWRMEELEAKRAHVPDDENGALRVIAAKKDLPQGWPTWAALARRQGPDLTAAERDDFETALNELLPPIQLNGQQAAALDAELKSVAKALTTARRLADMPTGRYAAKVPSEPSFLRPFNRDPSETARLLEFDVILRAHTGDMDGALASCRAILNTGRSFGDEPWSISQLIRVLCRQKALRKIERVLAQGQPSEAALQTLQRLLADEEQPLLLFTLRGERAWSYMLLAAFRAGKVKPEEFKKFHGRSLFFDDRNEEAVDNEIELLHAADALDTYCAASFRQHTQMVELAKLPVEQQTKGFKEFNPMDKAFPFLLRDGRESLSRLANGFHNSQTALRCAIAAVAVERYRRSHGRWPREFSEVVPAQLREVPKDPFDGKPLRFRGLEGGVVIYSIGPDAEDNGGNLARTLPPEKGTDLGFRLWDIEKRRQPPAGEP
jgi:hypothetical protein